MQRDTLFLLTHKFPYLKGEDYLWDELTYLSEAFQSVVICPLNCHEQLKPLKPLPVNVSVQLLDSNSYKPGIMGYTWILRALLSELSVVPSAKLFFRHLRFNLSLLKQNIKMAYALRAHIKQPGKTAVYSYWCDELATVAALTARVLPDVKAVSRAHGFDVFDDQSDYNHIFFRKFRIRHLQGLYSVSEKGRQYLAAKFPAYSSKIHCSRLGIHSDETICFEASDTIRLVTCSYIRSIKRLHLLPEILRHIPSTQKVEWYVIGDGPDLAKIEEEAKNLPPHITCIFKGYQDTSDIHSIYASVPFDYLVSLSSSEGLPVSMMEAISHGIPVLSTDVGGCGEIAVNGITGTLIDAEIRPAKISETIMAVKTSEFNTREQHIRINAFWRQNFSAWNNYRSFASILQTI